MESRTQDNGVFAESSEFYDLIYSFKDYALEANRLEERLPDSVSTILDVACGTGEHHRTLSTHYQVEGVDLNSTFLEIAKAKNPTVTYHQQDMRTLELPGRYDAIVCLFSSIGYLNSLQELQQTIQRMAEHLNPKGLLLVEPWFEPTAFQSGRVFMQTQEDQDFAVCRMARSERVERSSILTFDYLVGSPSAPTRHFQETHTMTLFEKAEMLQAFQTAGLECHFEEPGLSGRGLYLGTPA